MSYTNYPGDYPPNEPATASTYYSIGANRDQAVYDAHTKQDGPALFRIYVDECPFPPSPPPPPPTVAMCYEGYWPLYMTEAEAVAHSPGGSAHVHTFKGVDFYMPDEFDGAPRHTAPRGAGHAKTLPPFRRPRRRIRRPPRPLSPHRRHPRCRCRCRVLMIIAATIIPALLSCASRGTCGTARRERGPCRFGRGHRSAAAAGLFKI